MKINYKNRKLEKVCTNYSKAKQNHGEKMAKLIHQRIDQLNAIDSVEMLLSLRIGRAHKLEGDRKNQYAMDLVHPHRLIFTKDGVTNNIQIVKIISITDYH